MSFEPIDASVYQVIILPKHSAGPFQILNLPNPHDHVMNKFLLDKSSLQILELKKINYKNPHLTGQKVVTTRDGQVIKSLLLTNENDGMVLEKLEFLVGTNYDITWLLLSNYERAVESINNDDSFKPRLLPKQDMIESWQDSHSVLSGIPAFFFENNDRLDVSISKIFDILVENDESYYRLSIPKILKFLSDKVNLILDKFPESLYKKLIKQKLLISVEEELSLELIRSAKIHHSINLISCYISTLLISKLNKIYEKELVIYKDHLARMSNMKSLQNVALDNLNNLNSNLKVEKRVMTQQNKAVKKKKVVAKVAVGKGALDGFFKKL